MKINPDDYISPGNIQQWGVIFERDGKLTFQGFSIEGGSSISPFTEDKQRALLMVSIIKRLQKELGDDL